MDKELNKAIQYHQAGQLQQAEEIYKKILEIHPNHPDALHLLGVAAHQVGNNEKAVNLIAKAIQLNPDNPNYYNNLGASFRNQGKLDEAVSCYQKTLQVKPDYAEAYNNMGNVFREMGRTDEAISCYQKALQLRPGLMRGYNNLAAAFRDQGKIDEAISCYQKAVEIQPDDVKAYDRMGNAFRDQGKTDQAMSCYQSALQIKPDFGIEVKKALLVPVINESKEQISQSRKHLIQQLDALKNKGIRLEDPNQQIGTTNFYLAYHGLNDKDIQKKIADFYIHACPELETRNSKLETRNSKLETRNLKLETRNSKLETRNSKLETRNSKLETRNSELGTRNSKLETRNSKLETRNSKLETRNSESSISASSFKFQVPSSKFPIKIGFVSMHLYHPSQQTVGKLNQGIIKNLSKEKFHVTLFCFSEKQKTVADTFGADEVVVLPNHLKKAREKIAEHSLDILFYPDIGMDSLTYFLAFSRLAPVQCVTSGHPVTTGIPNIDYFISSDTIEPPDGDEHYSECLVRLKRLNICYERPKIPDIPLSREEFGLPVDRHLYVCPQAIFKFHPDFDLALGAILRRDPLGLFVLLEGSYPHFTKLWRNRFIRQFPDMTDRIRFISFMSHKNFLSLLMLSDVLIDPPYFGGGNTSYESFACGVPVVTWPGPFMRGRVTLALCKQMGVTDCVANDAPSYINIALRLANDKTWRDEVRSKIRANADVLFEDIEMVHELEDFFEKAVIEVSPVSSFKFQVSSFDIENEFKKAVQYHEAGETGKAEEIYKKYLK
ncbi:tetratricopeptide repeat protein [Desulfonema magnum]|uniref:protein O-GlcNAc transferase n=1 Tax=Desulfonema magnum TaxID=45655 RepID=A0A975BR15_9BACT|nr:glycosyltransferase family 41 protein [Desulfonema magnum]QTA90106.1 Tetratricopeptide repeat-containing protein [Desulfonema magnum]